MAVDQNNNVIAVGDRSAFVGDASIFTRKFDIAGNLLWERKDSTTLAQNYERASWVNTDADNNIYVCGYRYVGTSIDYTYAIVALKYNSDGDLIWKKDMEHAWPSGLSLRSEIDADGNYYIGTVGLNIGFNLIKLDPDGNIVFDVSDATSANQDFTSMRIKDDLVVLCSYGGNGTTACIAAFNTSGDYLWSNSFDSRSGIDVEIDDEHQIYVLSRKENQVSATSGMDLKVLKLASDGTLLNEFDYDFGSSTEFGTRLTLVNNKISIVGLTIPNGGGYMNWQILQIDLDGNLIWESDYDYLTGNDEQAYWIAARSNGEVFVCGKGGPEYVDFNGTSYLQFVVAKFSPTGELVWNDTNIYQGYTGITCALDGECGLYVLGQSAMTVTHYEDECEVVSIPETSQTSPDILDVYPNPTQGILTINHTQLSGPCTLTILDSFGRNVTQIDNAGSIDSNTQQIDISNLASGLYILKLSQSNKSYSVRFIKE